jgi:hypothetical protein
VPPQSVDSSDGRPYTRRSQTRFRNPAQGAAALVFALAVPALTGCAAAPPPDVPAGTAPADPAVAQAAVAATALERPLHVVFGWTLQEREARFSGRGVTRYAPPSRARLDLFGPRDETYLSAALVGMDLRLPAAAPAVPLPPPPLLWSVLGIVRPPEDARLVRARRDGNTTELEYERAGEQWTFRLEGDDLRHAEANGPGGRRTVELSGTGAHGLPQRAVYRDWPAFRELRLDLQEANEVDGFPQDIWNVGG